MAELVHKHVLLGYRPEAHDKPATHAILEVKEYRGLLAKIASLEASIKQQEAVHRTQMATMVKSYADEKSGLLGQISVLQSDVAARDQHLEAFRRICRERSNQARDLRPKKEHVGYLVVASSEYTLLLQREYSPSSKPNERETAWVWRTLVQTPYPVTLDAATAWAGIEPELADVFAKLGIRACADTVDIAKRHPGCISYKIVRLRDMRTGYWSIELHTTKSVLIPPEMIPPSQNRAQHEKKLEKIKEA
jgi:hypothetical protein